MIHRKTSVALVVAATLICLPACMSGKKKKDAGVASDKAAAADSAKGGGEAAKEHYYAEEYKDGRYYVLGSEKTAAAFRGGSGHMPFTRTLLGAGPGGATVVIESESKSDALADRLQAEFERRHGSR